MALPCFIAIANGDLARDLCNEVFALLGSGKVSVRKKAIGVTVRLFEKHPDAVCVCFKRLVESLDSTDSGVLSATVGVFCEQAMKDPKSYLPLAPEFYKDRPKSLVFEGVRTVLVSLSEFESAVRLAMEKVREFLVEEDPNLKYLGLHALSMASEKHLWAVLENKEVMIKSLRKI
ncbi:hypothetical protein MLD38_021776 [Melastoma candidum]|uniref:Uncharacterized protein n=1 Tax=Melastoma candidum TaxID=119954 RepID=A0ACB9QI25_9MYRT|nr:hypothetical protein MLD38_021776 [Melastoma candidum]